MEKYGILPINSCFFWSDMSEIVINLICLFLLKRMQCPDLQCHWNCCQALCTNNYSSQPQIKAYRLPPDIKIQKKYASALKTDGVNWCKAYVCSSHWSGGEKLSHDHIPDIAIPDSVINSLELRLAKTSRKERKLEEKLCHAKKLRTCWETHSYTSKV